jgi:hypothetical protein
VADARILAALNLSNLVPRFGGAFRAADQEIDAIEAWDGARYAHRVARRDLPI